jgi:SAM-dependent methyltransferase
MTKKPDILEHNRLSWNRQSIEGSPWCTPVDSKTIAKAREGNWQVILTPLKPVPNSWYGEIAGKDVLCLASGGGQQAPIFAAAGAKVVSFDNSEEQLKKDKMVADQNSLQLQTIQGDMANLSVFEDQSFDLIFHPVSNVFAADVKNVWRECFRILRLGGCLLSGFMNPLFFLFDPDEVKEIKELKVKYKLPYSDIEHLDKKRLQNLIDNKIALEFSHSLDDQIGGQIEAGFVITGFYEDWWDDEATLVNKFAPTFMATKANKS